MLAADHRWQWDESCAARSLARAGITEIKEFARLGFARARDRSATVRDHGALLLDHQLRGSVDRPRD
jgi:hypothetical protein